MPRAFLIKNKGRGGTVRKILAPDGGAGPGDGGHTLETTEDSMELGGLYMICIQYIYTGGTFAGFHVLSGSNIYCS